MRAVFERTELQVLLRDFYELTGIRAVVFDAWGEDILSYPEERPAFCALVRSTPGGREACLACDRNACRAARREKRAVVYPCHAGLIEVITPIEADGATVGYLLLSHIVQGADEEAEWEQVKNCCAPYGVDEDALREAYTGLTRTPYRVLRSAADLLALAARAMYQARLARLAPGSMQEKLNRFLRDHLAEELTGERICRELHVSRTSLYHLSKELYGCGVSDYISRLRIRTAASLLVSTSLTNAEICRRVGIKDYNYFFRVFRKQTGMTPRAYRRRFSPGGEGFSAESPSAPGAPLPELPPFPREPSQD